MSISLLEVFKSFSHGPTRLDVLRNFTATVGDGEFLGILGPSGCGKTTLLRLIAGLEAPDGGTVTIEHDRNRPLEMVFQEPALLPWRTALENVMLPIELMAHAPGANEIPTAKAKEMLDQMGLGDFSGYYPHQLSGGMRSRTAVARSLVTRPNVLLLDEPFSALDEITRIDLQNMLIRMCSTLNVTVVFVTHSVDEAVFISDRVLVLSPRPTTVVADLPVDIGRADKQRRESKKALEIRAELRGLLMRFRTHLQ